jgi:hypothetical protein
MSSSRLWLVACWALGSACPGDADPALRPDGPSADGTLDGGASSDRGLRSDAAPSDLVPGDAVVGEAVPCSAEGVAAACDPVVSSGCGSSVCYLTARGTACVCPPGSMGEGQTCGTSVECSARLICQGQAPPGTCRALCRPDVDGGCSGSYLCTVIQNNPSYGACLPRDGG